MGKLAPAQFSYRGDFVISYHVYMMTGNVSVFSSSHVQRVEADEAILDCLQTEFTPKRVVISRLHHTVAKSRTGVNSHRHGILWWYHVNKCRAMRGNRSELAPARKSPRCHVNTPIDSYWSIDMPCRCVQNNFLFNCAGWTNKTICFRASNWERDVIVCVVFSPQ